MHATKLKSRGFTIVELLIVIVVVAILASISVVAYNGVQSRSRDATRRSDLRNVQIALERFYVDNGYYPSAACLSSPWWNCWGAGSSTGRLVSTTYLQTMPQDPAFVDSAACGNPNNFQTRAYWYQDNAGQGYVLGTFMESVSSSDANYLATNGNYGCGNFMNWALKKNYPI